MADQSDRERLWLDDFATIFAHMWYRDFPIPQSLKRRRADWTIHMGVSVRSTADLLGLFTHFESGKRTDAILRDRKGACIAPLEWEWTLMHKSQFNELDKLKTGCQAGGHYRGARFAVLIGYATESAWDTIVDKFKKKWVGQDLPPLLLITVHSEWLDKKQGRKFHQLTIDKVFNGEFQRLREQPAYPWKVLDSRWQQETKA